MTAHRQQPRRHRGAAAAGAACDYRLKNAVTCPGGGGCAPSTALAGTCVAATAEAEPNDSIATRQGALTSSAVFHGALASVADVDCYGLTVPADASVFLKLNDANDRCDGVGGLSVTLRTAAGVEVADALCPGIDGPLRGPAHRLSAGAYVACVHTFDGPAGHISPSIAYSLTVGIVPAP